TAYWGVARDFLRVATEAWPEHLGLIAAVDQAAERDTLISKEAARIREDRGPVLAVASPSYVPAVADLLAAVQARPGGVVLLPGLDTGCDEEAWSHIRGIEPSGPDFGHAQSGLCHLLEHLRTPRVDVEPLGDARPGRDRVLSEALRPVETTERWADPGAKPDPTAVYAAFADVTLVEAANEREEALAVAVALRSALADGDERIALITPDRTLARRVEADLKRWDLHVDDSGGRPLGTTPPAVFARLMVEAVEARFAPIPLLALLKHPLAHPQDYAAEERYRSDVRALERIALRGLAPDPGLAGIARRLDADDAARLGAGKDVRTAPARRALASLDAATAALRGVFRSPDPLALSDLAAIHRDACLVLSGDVLWSQEDGEALRLLFDGLTASPDMRLEAREYPSLFVALMRGVAVRNRRPSHPRIAILGLLEARQLSFDTCVLAGLNEGVWPAQQRNDAWLSRPMRAGIGLPPPEKRLGEAAHDFAQAFASRRIILSRAVRTGGAPTIRSRWLQRLDAVAGEAMTGAKAKGDALLALARRVDSAPPAPRIRRPEPKPPVSVRPRRLPVTQVETWVRDPYSIYAAHILQLRPLDALDEAPGPRERGIVIHAALDAWSGHDPFADDAVQALRAAMDDALKPYAGRAEVASLWRRQMHAIADWVVAWERERRDGLTVHTEVSGEWCVPGTGPEPFVLTGRADRVEVFADGTFGLIDYKTGNVPTPPQMANGLAPQLALGAAMAAGGAFDGHLGHAGSALSGKSVQHLSYVELKGTRGGDREKAYASSKTLPPIDDLIAQTVSGLARLAAAYDNPDQGYPSMPRPQWRLSYGRYDHLARVREWALADDAGGEA
ncbi:MAG: double-strand break repair protein AddB, partial [Pseudomonadota bacterium]